LDHCGIFETTRSDRYETCRITGCKRYQGSELLKERPVLLIDKNGFSTLCRGVGQFCNLRGEIVSQKKISLIKETEDRTKK